MTLKLQYLSGMSSTQKQFFLSYIEPTRIIGTLVKGIAISQHQALFHLKAELGKGHY